MRKVAIIGSREFSDLTMVRDFINALPPDSIIVSGACRGVDAAAAHYARKANLQIIEFPANWNKFGKRAGLMRNQDIVGECTELAAFWDGASKGTKHSIGLAHKSSKPVTVFLPSPVVCP